MTKGKKENLVIQRHRKKKTENSGSSMVEVLVAVVIVMLMMAIISVALSTVMDLWNRSSNRLQEIIALEQDYYRKEPQKGTTTKTAVSFTLTTTQNGKNISIPVEQIEMEEFWMDNNVRTNLRRKVQE